MIPNPVWPPLIITANSPKTYTSVSSRTKRDVFVSPASVDRRTCDSDEHSYAPQTAREISLFLVFFIAPPRHAGVQRARVRSCRVRRRGGFEKPRPQTAYRTTIVYDDVRCFITTCRFVHNILCFHVTAAQDYRFVSSRAAYKRHAVVDGVEDPRRAPAHLRA